MESFLYDGYYTADCQIEDVRVGDIVEYSYTIEGANPVLRGKFYDFATTEWAIPVQRAVTVGTKDEDRLTKSPSRRL